MANKHNGEVSLLVGDKAFTLKLTSNKAAEAEQYMNGSSIFEFKGGLNSVRALLFVMAKGSNDVSTVEDAGDLIDEDPLAVTKAVNEASALFFQKYSPKKA